MIRKCAITKQQKNTTHAASTTLPQNNNAKGECPVATKLVASCSTITSRNMVKHRKRMKCFLLWHRTVFHGAEYQTLWAAHCNIVWRLTSSLSMEDALTPSVILRKLLSDRDPCMLSPFPSWLWPIPNLGPSLFDAVTVKLCVSFRHGNAATIRCGMVQGLHVWARP